MPTVLFPRVRLEERYGTQFLYDEPGVGLYLNIFDALRGSGQVAAPGD